MKLLLLGGQGLQTVDIVETEEGPLYRFVCVAVVCGLILIGEYYLAVQA